MTVTDGTIITTQKMKVFSYTKGFKGQLGEQSTTQDPSRLDLVAQNNGDSGRKTLDIDCVRQRTYTPRPPFQNGPHTCKEKRQWGVHADARPKAPCAPMTMARSQPWRPCL